MALRNLHTDLKAALVQNDEFIISHLIRFEKPVPSDQQHGGYVYVTDGPYEIVHGGNTYLPNKVLNLGTIREETLAKASAMTLQLSATALGTNLSTNVTFNATNDYLEIGQNAVEAGFKEGDTIDFEHASSTHTFEIISFAEGASGEDNGKIFVTPKSPAYSGFTNVAGVLTQANPEVKSLLLDHISDSTKASYIHREVLIERVYINPETGAIIGEPFTLFIGYINKGSLKEDVSKGSSVTWSLTNHWGDFVKIQGRKTSDNEHRALGIDDTSDEESIHREEYKTDYGFEHSQRAVNTVANFMGKEKRFKFKKSGFLGLGSGRTIEYDVDVEREVDIRFNLSAKYLPVVYGVRKIDSFPIFADAFKDIDSGKVVVAQALCEGDIAGIFDIHVDDQSAVCIDSPDSANRSGDDAPFVCQGNLLRGDAISSMPTNKSFTGDAIATNIADHVQGSFLDFNFDFGSIPYNSTVPTVEESDTITLDTDPVVAAGRSCYLPKPTPVVIDIFTGQSEQRASDRLRKYSVEKKFKIQEDYFGNSTFYWTGNHTLLDTAYTVAEYQFSDSSAVVPKMEYVVKGKYLNCYGYDFCLDTAANNPREDFNIGDAVQFTQTDGTLISSTQYRVDQLIATRKPANRTSHLSTHDDGVTANYRMRFNGLPDEVYDHATVLVKKVGTNTTLSATPDSTITAPEYQDTVTVEKIPAVSITDMDGTTGNTSGKVVFTVEQNSSFEAAMAAFTINPNHSTYFSSHQVAIRNATQSNRMYGFLIANGISSYDASTNKLTMQYLTWPSPSNAPGFAAEVKSDFDAGDDIEIVLLSVTKGDDNWTTAGASVGRKIRLVGPDGYGTYRDAAPSDINGQYLRFDWLQSLSGQIPEGYTTASVQNFSAFDDFRVSTNPVIQLLDYLTSTRYGKGLDIKKDINIESFRAAARDCDERSEVTITVLNTASVSVNQVYKLTDTSGNLIFQGTVSNVSDSITFGSGQYKEVTFNDVIGKLCHRHNRDRRQTTGHYVYSSSGVLKRVTADGYYTISQHNALPTVSHNSLSLTRVDDTGTLSIRHISGDPSFLAPNGNPVVKSFVPGSGFIASGYSLYDSDDVKYWRLLGWDEPVQDNVTRHQCNVVLDTSKSLFSNVNLLLRQFNGILRYSAGKYEVIVRKDAPTVGDADSITIDNTEYTPSKIHKDDIIGSLKIDSAATKDTYNSVTSSIIDPQNKFGGREVTFFNSEYLKQDRGISKQGNFSMAGVTNYFNARINIQQFLDESRGGLTVSFTTKPQAVLLLAGDFIYLTHEDYGFEDKVFRISNIGIKDNGLVDITAKEHNSKAYKLKSAVGEKEVTEGSGESNQDLLNAPVTAISSDSFTATVGVQTVELSWTQSSSYSPATHQVEVWRKGSGDSGDYGVHIATVSGDEFTDKFTQIDQSDTYQYWVRYVINVQQPGEQGVFQRFSAYTNKGEANNGGLQAIVAPLNAANINYGASGDEVSIDDLKPNEAGADNTTGQLETGVSIESGGVTFAQANDGAPSIKAGQSGFNAGGQGFFLGYDTNAYKFSIGDPSTTSDGERLTWDGSSLTITGDITASSITLQDGVTLDEDDLSTSVNASLDLADSATQSTKGLALNINRELRLTNGTDWSIASIDSNPGEAVFTGFDKNGNADASVDGYIYWDGQKVTVPRTSGYYSTVNATTVRYLHLLTRVTDKRGFILFDLHKTAPFTTSSFGNRDFVFAWKDGEQWYYDQNHQTGVTFTPSTITGNVTGSTPTGTSTTDPRIVALGYLEVVDAASDADGDNIIRAGLFDNPVDVELAAFPSDVIQSGSIGGVKITSTKLYQGDGDFDDAETGFYLDSTGQFSLKDKLSFNPTGGAGSTPILEVDGNITAQTLNIENATVTGTLSANNVAIDDVSIDTNASGQLIIKSDGVRSSHIEEGSTNVVNPASQTGHTGRWGGSPEQGTAITDAPTGTSFTYDSTEKALKLTTTSTDVSVSSDSWLIDHDAIYQIRFSIKKSTADGRWYFGAGQKTGAYRAGDTNTNIQHSTLDFKRWNDSRVARDDSTNPYFDNPSENQSNTDYVDYVVYLMGGNVSIDEVPHHSPDTGVYAPYVQFDADATYGWLRFLNWDNSGQTTERSVFVKDVKVEKLYGGQIVAGNILANTITGTEISASTKIVAGTSNNVGVLDGEDDTFRIYAGNSNPDSAPFRVSQTGEVTATSATVAGTITANTFIMGPDAIVLNNIASELEDDTVTIDSLAPETINYIDQQIADYTGNNSGAYRVIDFNIDKDTTENTSLGGGIDDFDHGTNDPKINVIANTFMYLADNHTGTDLDLEFKVYAKRSDSETWGTAISTISKSATVTEISTNPAADRFLHTIIFHESITHDIDANDAGQDFDYKIELSTAPEFADENIFIQFYVQEIGVASAIDAATLDSLDSTQFMRSDTDTTASEYIKHKDDADTHIRFEDDKITLTAGNKSMITMQESIVDSVDASSVTIHENVVLSKNLTVSGTTTTLNTSTLDVQDKNITLNYNSTADTSTSANDAGITIQDAVDANNDASILWKTETDHFEVSHKVKAPTLQSSGTIVAGSTIGNLNTDNDIGQQLEVGNATVATLRFDSDRWRVYSGGAGGVGERLTVLETGNVGIGKTDPSEKLWVAGNIRITSGALQIDSDTEVNTYGLSETIRIDNTAATVDRQLQFFETLNAGAREHIIAFNTNITTDESSGYTYTQGNYGGSSVITFHNDGDLSFESIGQQASGSTTDVTSTIHETMRITQDGKLNITPSGDDGVSLTVTDNAPNDHFNAMKIDYDVSGATAISGGSKWHRALLIDVDTSASGGSTGSSEEHRVAGIEVDIQTGTAGDSDLIYGVRGITRSKINANQNSAIYGGFFQGVNDSTGTGKVNTTYGSFSQALSYADNTNTDDQNLTGAYAKAGTAVSGTGRYNDITGLYAEVELNTPSSDATIDNITGVKSIIDNNDLDTVINATSVTNGVVIATAHGYANGTRVRIVNDNTNNSLVAGDYVISNSQTNQFTLENAGSAASGSDMEDVTISRIAGLDPINSYLFYGSYVSNVHTASNNSYGIYIEDAGAKNYFQGKVGIGTASPQHLLHVDGTARVEGQLMVGNSANTNTIPDNVALHIKNDGIGARIRIEDKDGDPNSYWDMLVDRGDSFALYEGETERLTFKEGGDLGIGISAPEAAFHVHGSVDGEFGAIISNTKTYGASSGTNETASLALGIKEAATTVSNRLFAKFVAETQDETSSATGNLRIKVRHASELKDRIVIDGNGKVGINEESPLGVLHIKNGDAGAFTANDLHDDLIVENSGSGGIQLMTTDHASNTYYQYLAFGTATTPNAGYVRYQHTNGANDTSSDEMRFRVGSTDRVKIAANGRVTLDGGFLQETVSSIKTRKYYIESTSGITHHYLGTIRNSANDTDGSVSGIIHFSYDYGTTTNSNKLHFEFSQRAGTARGTWWYEGDDIDSQNNRVYARLIDDGDDNYEVWVTAEDYAKSHVESVWVTSNPVESGIIGNTTLTTGGTTLSDTTNAPTGEMHVGSLFIGTSDGDPSNKLSIGGEYTIAEDNARLEILTSDTANRKNAYSNLQFGLGKPTPLARIHNTGTIYSEGGVTFDPVGDQTGDTDGTDTTTTAAFAMPRGQRLVGTYDGYIRNLLDWSTDTHLKIGQTGTSLIGGIKIFPGNAGSVEISNSSDTTPARLTIEDINIGVSTTTEIDTNGTVVDTFAHATYRTAKYTVQLTQGTNYQAAELLLIHDGTNTYLTEYAVIHNTTTPLAFYSAAINGNNVELKVTQADNNTDGTVKVLRHSITS